MLREQHQHIQAPTPRTPPKKTQRTMHTFVYSAPPICLIRYFVYTLHFRS